MKSIEIASPAKINLTLDVMNLRSDGYHSIASVMQSISLADTIQFNLTDSQNIALTCNDPDLPTDANNLVHRAAVAMLKELDMNKGLTIHLEKRVPSQAGLGGGSSNAAFTLIALNELLNGNLSKEKLMQLAATLGSDVPFFIQCGTAVARGRGELISALQDIETLHLVIVKPDVAVSTAIAYAKLDAIADRSSNRNSKKMQEAILSGDSSEIIARMSNDFERVILPDHLEVQLLFDDLMMARAMNIRLCGSGSAVFGVFASESEAMKAGNLLRRKYDRVFVCRSISRMDALPEYSQSLRPEISL